MRRLARLRPVVTTALVLALAPAGVTAQSAPQDLALLSLEELLRIEVTSVSRKEQPLSEAPAAIFVLTAIDIRRSGLTSLPELLRLAPGVQVARYSNSKWSVSARGFGRYYSNKLLVLVDGRSIFSPDFSGVYWDMHEMPLDDIERIEVIRGPGGTMWGANAVNGVINIITRRAADTLGSLAVLGTGSEDRGLASFRFGDAFGAGSAYRVYLQGSHHASAALPSDDRSRMVRGGFRVDHRMGRGDLQVQGNAFDSAHHVPIALPDFEAPFTTHVRDTIDARGADLSLRWTRPLAAGGTLSLRTSFDHLVRNEYIHPLEINVLDVDFQHRARRLGRHDIVWGAGYRADMSSIQPSDVMVFSPRRTRRSHFSAFAQDEIAIRSGLRLTLGTKLEQHEAVGSAVEPNVRVWWQPRAGLAVWAALSGGVRTPPLADQHGTFRYLVLPGSAATGGLPVEILVTGDPDVDALEAVRALEVGSRVQPHPTLALDVAAFRHRYDHLSSYSRGPAVPVLNDGPGRVVIRSTYGNQAEGESYGLEIAGTWTPVPRWTFSGTATAMQVDLRMSDPTIEAGNSLLVQLLSPRFTGSLRAGARITRTVDGDAVLFVNGPWQRGGVAGYHRVDVRGGWQISREVRLDAGVQNLIDRAHVETAPYLYTVAQEIRRTGSLRLSWQF